MQKVVTAVATGNLKQKLSIVSRGEVAQLTDTINEMIDTLALFGDQVTTVAREVGVEGRLGGQASVPGASGIWKNLTENCKPACRKPYNSGTCDFRSCISRN